MYSLEAPMFPRKLSFGSLIDLSEKQALGPNAIRPRVAIIGAGVTGVSTACHILDAGFECHIFEAGNKDSIGGIWTKVNDTSALQIHSTFYKFHDAVHWQSDYPNRKEILGQVRRLWDHYGLAQRSTFGCKVTSTYQEEDGKWVVNDPSYGYFDGIVAAVGTCGEVYAPTIAAQESFKGRVLHSSELDRSAVKGKNIVVVGGGASAVEALEFACDNGAASIKVLARSEKWFIPRRPWLNAGLAATIGDRFGILAWILESLIRFFFYKDLWEMAPVNSEDGIYNGTPIVNSRVLQLIRKGHATWQRGDVQRFTPDGVIFSRRSGGAPKGTIGDLETVEGDVCILATGYTRPTLSFLPPSKTDSKHRPPNWYMQCFPTENPTVCAPNCTWKDGIGTVGGGHIGVYTRFLLVFLIDPRTAPSEGMMQAWVDAVHVLKKPYAGGALSFITSAEIFLWFLVAILIQPALWPWTGFILCGPGSKLSPTTPLKVKDTERPKCRRSRSAFLEEIPSR